MRGEEWSGEVCWECVCVLGRQGGHKSPPGPIGVAEQNGPVGGELHDNLYENVKNMDNHEQTLTNMNKHEQT